MVTQSTPTQGWVRCLDGAVSLKTLVLPEKQGPNEDQRVAAPGFRPTHVHVNHVEGLTKHQGMPSASPVDLTPPPFLGLLFLLIS